MKALKFLKQECFLLTGIYLIIASVFAYWLPKVYVITYLLLTVWMLMVVKASIVYSRKNQPRAQGQVINEMMRLIIQERTHIAFYGPRGSGKTTILHKLKGLLDKEENILPVYLSLEGIKEKNFWQTLITIIKEEFGKDIETKKYADSQQLEVTDLIEKVCKSSKIDLVVLLLDEGEQLTEKFSQETQQCMRNLDSESREHLVIVLAGEKIFEREWIMPTSPFGDHFRRVNIMKGE